MRESRTYVLCGGRSAMSVPTAITLFAASAMSPVVALPGGPGMSAIRSLSGVKRTRYAQAEFFSV